VGIFKAVALGILQGLTEFLPVSSSGHLVLAQQLFPAGITHAVAFDVCLHFGTLVAVVVYFRADLLRMARAVFLRGEEPGRPDSPDSYLGRWVWLLGAATVPVGIVGLLFAGPIEHAFGSTRGVGIALLCTSVLLVLGSRHLGGRKGPEKLGLRDALVIGLFQAVAIIPGISRAGSTITGGLLADLQPGTAARFAFLLSIPAELISADPAAVAAGTVAAGLTGWLAIEIMMRAVRLGRLAPFAVYCAVLGCVTLLAGWSQAG
jgi:undecaprenyl-diphosphatase